MKIFILAFLFFGLIGGIFSRWQKSEKTDLDQQVLEQLKKAGSDLLKPHTIEFFFYFPNEKLANQAAQDIKVEVDDLEVELGADKKNWLCFATKRMVPKHDELVRLRKRFNQIARKYDGEYDGWGTLVEK
jgi:regulator of RNase E activity RraB